MLQEVLTILRQRKGAISQDAICAQTGLSPQMLAQMMDTLVRAGRLIELDQLDPEDCGYCSDCSEDCHSALEDVLIEKRYVLKELLAID